MGRISEIERLGLGDEVLALRLQGMTHQNITSTIKDKYGMDVSRRSISRYLNGLNDSDREPTINVLKLELSQDMAKGQFMNHIAELNRRYERVKDSTDTMDRQEANSILRLLDTAIDKFLKVTGLYDHKREVNGADLEQSIRKELEDEVDRTLCQVSALLVDILDKYPDGQQIRIDLSKALLRKED